MNTETSHTRPVNKSAALFLTRKERIETIQAALDRFAVKVCSPEAAASIKEMLARNSLGEHVGVRIAITIKPDNRQSGRFFALLSSRMIKDLGEEHFGLLDP